jgi:valyl-tRNA synthetase
MNTEGEDCGLEQHGPDACAAGQYLEFSAADRWISNEFERTLAKVQKGFEDYRFDTVASALYQFIWDEFCDWYLEIAKVQLQTGNEGQRRATRRTLIRTLEKSLRMAHPIIPFITEELWQKVAPVAGFSGNSVMVRPYPSLHSKTIDKKADEDIVLVKGIVSSIRALRSELGVGPSKKLPVSIIGDPKPIKNWDAVICTLTKSSELIYDKEIKSNAEHPSRSFEGFTVTIEIEIDFEAEKEKLQTEIVQITMQLARETAKLKNEGFIKKAPESIVSEVKRRVESLGAQERQLTEQLDRLRDKI